MRPRFGPTALVVCLLLLGAGLVGCGETPLSVRYGAERQLWKARQLERRVNSQPEAAGAQVEEAKSAYSEVLAAFPLESVAADSSELRLLGQIRGAAGLGLARLHLTFDRDPDAAIEVLEKLRGDTPWDIGVTGRLYSELLRAAQAHRSGEEVVALLDEVVERIPPVDAAGEPLPLSLEAPTQKAEILRSLGKEVEAEAELQVAHVYYDDVASDYRGSRAEVAALLQKANVFVLEGRADDADATLTRASEAAAAGESVPGILQTQANLRQQVAEDPLGAIRILERIQREFPDDPRTPGALLQIGIAYRAANYPDSALAAFDRVEVLYPRDVAIVSQARFLGAKILEVTGRADEAVRRYRTVAAEFPRTQSGLLAPLELAALFERQGNPEAARAELGRAIEEYARIARDLAGDQREAGVVLTAMDHRIDSLTRLDRWEEAVEALVTRAEQFPNDPRSPLAYVRAATIQSEHLGNRQAAISILQRLASRYPDLPLAQQASEMIERLRDAS